MLCFQEFRLRHVEFLYELASFQLFLLSVIIPTSSFSSVSQSVLCFSSCGFFCLQIRRIESNMMAKASMSLLLSPPLYKQRGLYSRKCQDCCCFLLSVKAFTCIAMSIENIRTSIVPKRTDQVELRFPPNNQFVPQRRASLYKLEIRLWPSLAVLRVLIIWEST